MCQFSYLTPGEKVELETQSGTKCLKCSSAVQYTGPAVYTGHGMDGGMITEVFDIAGLWICPGCGSSIYEYVEPCHDYGELIEQPVYTMETIIK